MSGAQTTTNHDTIRRWAEERSGRPARVKSTGTGDDPGILRIDFAEPEPDENLESIDWQTFFEKFDENDLAFLYEEHTTGGEMSRFCKFIRKPR